MSIATAAVNAVPYLTLNNGARMPGIGMGCWMGDDSNEIVEEMVKNALANGYRHIDTAFGYGNEERVGKAIRESGLARSEIFLTTKLPNLAHHRVRESFEESFSKLNCGYIDLYLMHWPQARVGDRVLQEDEHPTFVDTWKDMEKLLNTGKVKSIGISNFSIKNLEKLLPRCTVIPATNQVELHPSLPQFELVKYCQEKGIVVTAYSPFGQYKRIFFEDPDFISVAKAHNATVAQVAIAWALQRGTVPIPKSANIGRMKENISLIHLTPEEMELVNNIHKKPGMHRSLVRFGDSPPDKIFGWTYEQLGWPMTTGGIVVA